MSQAPPKSKAARRTSSRFAQNVLVRANNWTSIRQVFKEAYPIIKESQRTRHIAMPSSP
jgi:hypothetical protein